MYLTINRNGLHQKQERECIKKIWEADPLLCPKCGGEIKIISFITDSKTIRKILEHLAYGQKSLAELHHRSTRIARKLKSFMNPLMTAGLSGLEDEIAVGFN